MKSVIGVILLLIWQANSTPMENSFGGYDYPPPSCPLLYPSTITSFIPQLHFVTANFTTTETIVTVLKPSTITTTTTVPTTITGTVTDTIIKTDFQTSTTTIKETLPRMTTFSTTTKWKTTSYPVTTTKFETVTDFQRETSTRFTTVTQTQNVTLPVTTIVTTTAVCTPNNAYLPARDDPTCVMPPPRTYLPVDILPPIGPSVPASECPEAITSTATTTIYRDAPKATVTITPSSRAKAARENGSTKYVMKDVVTVTKSLTRTTSVILYDQLVTKRVSVTPTLTSYIYLDAVTKTMPARRSPDAVLG